MQAAVAVLDRAPSAALTLEELRERLKSEVPHGVPDSERLLRILSTEPESFHVLRRPERGWSVAFGPEAWILGLGPRGASHPHDSFRERLRASVAALGREVAPDSMLAWAGWNRTILEERRVLASIQEADMGDPRGSGSFTHWATVQ